MAVIPNFYINAVASIGVKSQTGISWIGTGFFIKRIVDSDGNACPMLVTNKHVLENVQSILLRLKKRNSDTFDTVPATLENNGKILYYTHSNKQIDIAVLPLNGTVLMEQNLEFNAFDIDNHAMCSDDLREDQHTGNQHNSA